MSTDFTAVCDDCRLYRHLGQRMAATASFGYGSNDAQGREQAAEFLLEHLGHRLRVVVTDSIPDGYQDAQHMSLDVYLLRDVSDFKIAADVLDEKGFTLAAAYLRDKERDVLYNDNITHNLGQMAEAAGIYNCLWRPEEFGITHARQLIPLLKAGLERMRGDPELFRQFDASNGFGRYDDFMPWVASYLKACEENPDALVEASR